MDFASRFPLLCVKGELIVNKRGELTIGWELRLPEAHSVSVREYEQMNDCLVAAAKVLPPYSVIHRQDIFTYRRYEPRSGKSFLGNAYEQHFKGRPYLDHKARLFLSLSSMESVLGESRRSMMYYSFAPDVKVMDAQIEEFVSKAEEFIGILTQSGGYEARLLEEEDYLGTDSGVGIIQETYNLGNCTGVISDVQAYPDRLVFSDRTAFSFDIGEARFMPSSVSDTVRIDALSSPSSEVVMSTGSRLGLLLATEHIVNQIILVPPQGKALAVLDQRLRRKKSGSDDMGNQVGVEESTEYLRNVQRNSNFVVYYNLNVLSWCPPELLSATRTRVSTALTSLGMNAVQNLIDVNHNWYSSIPGAAVELGYDHFMMTDIGCAAALTAYETFERGVRGGRFRVTDRIRNIPVDFDMDVAALEAGLIESYNKFILGPTGTGKSFFMNSYLRSRYDAGDDIFLIDNGESYKAHCLLVNEESGGRDGFYYSWDAEHPYTFCPFEEFASWLDAGGRLRMDSPIVNSFIAALKWLYDVPGGWTSQKESMLVSIVESFVILCRKNDPCCTKRYVFDDFFRYVNDRVQPEILAGTYMIDDIRVTFDMFNIKDFLLAIKPYSAGGVFSFLLNDPEPKDMFNSRFNVFEVATLSQVKDEKFYPLCIHMLISAFDRKMRENIDVHKVFVVEEAWKAISNESMAPYLRELWKTARKYNTAAVVVTQELDDILGGENSGAASIIKDTLVKNSPVKVLLKMDQYVNDFDRIQEFLSLTDIQKGLALSVGRGMNPKYRYNEAMICLGVKKTSVVAIEESREGGMVFESRMDRKKPLFDYAAQFGWREAVRYLLAARKLENSKLGLR